MAELNALDATVITLYFAVVIVVGLWVGRGERDAEDYFLAGRSLPWPGILGVVLLGFYYWTLNQYFVRRALAARTPEHGRSWRSGGCSPDC